MISPTLDQNLSDTYSLATNGKICLVNNRPGTIRESSNGNNKGILSNDPWIRRYDPSYFKQSVYHHTQPSIIQYETRPYYHSLASTSDDCLSQQHHRQSINNTIDKDIEYVESRLRGHTTVSLPNSHLTNHINWRQISNESTQEKYSKSTQTNEINPSPKSTLTSRKSQTFESVKRVTQRLEKNKDQKAARTLSAILIAFIVTWLPYNTNIVISTLKPGTFERGFLMYWERFVYILCYINSTIK